MTRLKRSSPTSGRLRSLSRVWRAYPISDQETIYGGITSNTERAKVSFRNWLSLSGAVIAIGSLFAFLLLIAMDLIAGRGNPYMGILAYLVAPVFLVLGLVLMGVGALRQRRHLRHLTPGTQPQALMIDLSRPRDRKAAAFFIVGSIIFLLLTAIGSQRTYQSLESVQFCGQACHVADET